MLHMFITLCLNVVTNLLNHSLALTLSVSKQSRVHCFIFCNNALVSHCAVCSDSVMDFTVGVNAVVKHPLLLFISGSTKL
jgi:hypothetical protein